MNFNATAYDLIEAGSAFANPLISAGASVGSGLTSSATAITNLGSVADTRIVSLMNNQGLTSSVLTTSATALKAGTAGVTTLVAYGDKSIADIHNRMSTSASYNSALAAAGRAPTDCSILSKTFGIVQQKGKEWLDKLSDLVSSVNGPLTQLAQYIAQGYDAAAALITEYVGKVKAVITTAVAAVNQVISDITAGIAEELKYISDMAKSCVSASIAYFLDIWKADGCMSGVLDSVASPNLKSVL